MSFSIQDPDGRGSLPDLHFVGTPFMGTRQSALLMGLGEDAFVVMDTIVADLAS